jgi:hypothetical protein
MRHSFAPFGDKQHQIFAYPVCRRTIHMTTAQRSANPAADPRTTDELIQRYREARAFTERMCHPMEIEDYVIQSMQDVSPTKWHLAHTTWFFETFILSNNYPHYQPLNRQYNYLFNS